MNRPRANVVAFLFALSFLPGVVAGQGPNPTCDPGCPPGAIDEIVEIVTDTNKTITNPECFGDGFVDGLDVTGGCNAFVPVNKSIPEALGVGDRLIGVRDVSWVWL